MSGVQEPDDTMPPKVTLSDLLEVIKDDLYAAGEGDDLTPEDRRKRMRGVSQ